jgi:tartrate dehydrogenase/decarboxylase / D-malate dehydrogenase
LSHRIAVIPGDGIGVEVIDAGQRVLNVLAEVEPGLELDFQRFPWGSDYFRANGIMMPADGVETLRGFDAIYFGAVGDREVADHITLWGLRLAICQGLDQYANVRPTRLLPGIRSPLADIGPGDLDWVIVRENSEGEYAGIGGRGHKGLPEEVGVEISLFTRNGVERIMRFAFELARSRPRKRLTAVTKSNAQRHGMVMWDEIFEEVSRQFPDVATDKMLVDAMTVRMVRDPKSLDTIVATTSSATLLARWRAVLGSRLRRT